MKFGLIFELDVPRPWSPASERRAFELALEQATVADEVGFDSVWVVEHHFLEEYSHSSAPDLFLATVAARTERVRLGHGICTILPGLNHPVRAAERAAWLDIISGGRLEFGTGRSSTWTELGGFGIDPEHTKAMWDDALRAIPRMWRDEHFEWDSDYFRIPPRNVLPKPIQKPHPPLWVAVSSPQTAVEAADRGIGMFGVSVGTPEKLEERVREYHRRIQQCDPIGEVVNDQIFTLTWLYVDEDRRRGHRMGEALIGAFNRMATQTVGINQVVPSKAYPTPGLLFALRRDAMAEAESLIKDGFAIGDPDDVIRAVQRWESLGVDGLTFIVNSRQLIPQDQVLESLRLFAGEVMPRFRKNRDRPAAEFPIDVPGLGDRAGDELAARRG